MALFIESRIFCQQECQDYRVYINKGEFLEEKAMNGLFFSGFLCLLLRYRS